MTQSITTVDDLKLWLFKSQYNNLIQYMENDEAKARKFLSAVVSCFSNAPTLRECSPDSLMQSFMKMAELDIFPSNVSGQAYVLPYGGKAQFQLWYQWLVTLFYRSGAKAIRSEIVRECDQFSYENGIIRHSPDVFNPERSKSPAIGAYVIIDLPTWGAIAKAMGKTEIFSIRDKFSKSKDSVSSPWNESKDPELWMWKKTVLKQVAKLVPKNERIMKAIEYDNDWDTDFAEIDKNYLKNKSIRPSEWSILDLIPETPIAPTPEVKPVVMPTPEAKETTPTPAPWAKLVTPTKHE